MANSVTRNKSVLEITGKATLAAIVAAGLGLACTDSGSDSSNTGGTPSSSGGSATSNSGGTISADTGGSTATGAGGSAAASSGGTATGTSGAGGALPAECLPCRGATPAECTPVPPLAALLFDFSTSNPFGNWNESTTLKGGTYVWPGTTNACGPVDPYPITSVVENGGWHLTGTVGPGTAGSGIWFNPCFANFTGYTGISFTVSGDAGPSGGLTMLIATPADAAPPVPPAVDCTPNSNTCTAATCTSPSTTIPVTSTPTTQTVRFADLTNGVPVPSPDPAAITQIAWNFVWNATPYPVDVIFDDIQLVQ
jgi:hypothetical protein